MCVRVKYWRKHVWWTQRQYSPIWWQQEGPSDGTETRMEDTAAVFSLLVAAERPSDGKESRMGATAAVFSTLVAAGGAQRWQGNTYGGHGGSILHFGGSRRGPAMARLNHILRSLELQGSNPPTPRLPLLHLQSDCVTPVISEYGDDTKINIILITLHLILSFYD